MPIEWLLLALLAGGAAVVVTIALLTMGELLGWFEDQTELTASDKDYMAVADNKGLEQGKYVVLQGVLNRKTRTMIRDRKIVADKLDAKVESTHKVGEMVVYD